MRRTVDRLERRALVVAIVLAVLAVPVAVLIGAAVQRTNEVTVATENATAHPATAILLRDVPPDSPDAALDTGTALAEWHTATGKLRTGPVQAQAGTRTGARVPIWLDGTGRPVAPPLTSDQAYWRGVLTVVLMLLAAFTVIVIGYSLAHWLLDRRRLAEWEADWRTVEPRWSHRD